MIQSRTLLQYMLRPDLAAAALLRRLVGIRVSTWFVNIIFQRVLRLNGDAPFQVHFTSTVVAPSQIVVGRNVWKSFARSGGCYVQGGNGVHIGDDSLFGPGVKIVSANHSPETSMAWCSAPPVKIGRRCWIGANAVILAGVDLGDDCVVGAGAVVTKSFPAGSVIGGVPARLLSKHGSGSASAH